MEQNFSSAGRQAKPLTMAGTRALKLGITPVMCLLANASSWLVLDLHSAGLMDR